MARLTVNVDHVATIRQARLAREPDPVEAAILAEHAGADGITVHLREDRRHIQDRDLLLLRKVVKTRLNLEMAPTEQMLSIALDVKPDMVTLVPERREELTTEGGLDVRTYGESLRSYIATLRDGAIQVNLFIDAMPDVVKMCHRIGADGVEIHTGPYAEATTEGERRTELRRIQDCAILAKRLGLKVHAGHGLDYHNIKEVVKIKEIEEFAIGFSIVARSVYSGMDRAVRDMVALINRG